MVWPCVSVIFVRVSTRPVTPLTRATSPFGLLKSHELASKLATAWLAVPEPNSVTPMAMPSPTTVARVTRPPFVRERLPTSSLTMALLPERARAIILGRSLALYPAWDGDAVALFVHARSDSSTRDVSYTATTVKQYSTVGFKPFTVYVVLPAGTVCSCRNAPTRPPATMNGTVPADGSVQVNVTAAPSSRSLRSRGAPPAGALVTTLLCGLAGGPLWFFGF